MLDRVILNIQISFVLTFRASAGDSFPGPEDHNTSTPANITKGTTPITTGNDEKIVDQFSDAAKVSEEHKDVEPCSLGGNDVKQGGDGTDHDQKHGGEKSASKLSDGTDGDGGHAKTLYLHESDGKEAVILEDENKGTVLVDNDAKDGSSKPNGGSQGPTKPNDEIPEAAHTQNDKQDPGQLNKDKTGTVASKPDNDQDKVLSLPGNVQPEHLTPTGRSGALPETKIDKKTAEVDERDKTTPEIGTEQSCDSNKGSPAGHPTETTPTAAARYPSNSKERQDADGEFITVIFHALLTPTFSLNFYQGDRVVLRGQSPFSWNAKNEVKIRVVRY